MIQQLMRMAGRGDLSPVTPDILYARLLDPGSYDDAWGRMEQRSAESRRFRTSFANHPELSLEWMLGRRRYVMRWMLAKLRARDYAVSPARESECIVGGKRRVLYRLDWPDRLLQTVLAQLLSQCWETEFADSLFSYRKGRSAMGAVRRAARFVRAHDGDGPLFVIKRDVKSYGDHVPHGPLMAVVKSSLPGADPFVIELVRQFIAFSYFALDGQLTVKSHGLPTGMPINCVLENLYLHPVDQAVSRLPGVSYMRYGDDLWLATAKHETAAQAVALLDELITDRGLVWHPDKRLDVQLGGNAGRDLSPLFVRVSGVPHLGVVINARGHIAIPAEKLSKWRADFKVVLHRANYMARRLRLDPAEKIRLLVQFANRYLSSRSRHIPKLDYLLTLVTEDQCFIELDRWIAETILAVHYGRYSRTNFRKTPYRVLKENGLPSLYLRRQAMYQKKADGKRRRASAAVTTGRAGSRHG